MGDLIFNASRRENDKINWSGRDIIQEDKDISVCMENSRDIDVDIM